MKRDVTIPTPDGDARAFVFTPNQGRGPWPAVILFMDAPAIRPALFDMAERLAQSDYYVLLPDLFWRAGPYTAARHPQSFAPAIPTRWRCSQAARLDRPRQTMSDTKACLDWLAKQPDAKAEKIGVTGYCMGGAIALRAAGNFPDRIAAAASFHGGNMATDDANSPHLLAPKIKAKVLVAGAEKSPLRRSAERAAEESAQGCGRRRRRLHLERLPPRLGAGRHARAQSGRRRTPLARTDQVLRRDVEILPRTQFGGGGPRSGGGGPLRCALRARHLPPGRKAILGNPRSVSSSRPDFLP